MSSQTTNLDLNIWDESDIVDFDELNDNFETIDGLPIPYSSGTCQVTYTQSSGSPATWRWRKYTDGTIEMSTKLEYTNMKCNGGAASPYWSGASSIAIPSLGIASIYDVQMHLASNTIGWVSDITNVSIGPNTNITFRVMAKDYESDNVYKQIFVNVKGVLSNV